MYNSYITRDIYHCKGRVTFVAPKIQFTKEQIIEIAFTIAKKEGIDKITIRKVAHHLGSSIAPIYVNFKNVKELKHEVIKRIVTWSNELIEEQHTGSPFKDIGIASIKMATEHPKLVHDFIMKQNEYLKSYDTEMGLNFIHLMKNDEKLAEFTENELYQILLKMRIFQMGLTLMIANGLLPEHFGFDEMVNLSNDLANDVITTTKLKKK